MMAKHSKKLSRFISLSLISLLISTPAWAQSFIERQLNRPVPGGIAVVALQDRGVSPQVTYEGRSVMVIPNNESGGYLAIVGIAQNSYPGTHSLQVNYGGRDESLSYYVGS